MTSRLCGGRLWQRLALALCVPLTAVSLLVGCGRDNPLNEPVERFGMVEVPYDRAIRLSVAEVPAGELAALELRGPESDSPVWESRVMGKDEQLHTVRLGATRGEVLGTSSSPALTDAERQALSQRLDRARILPDEAAREAADHGETVTAVRLEERDGVPVWRVSVLGVADDEATVHVVDATTGKVVERLPA
ncbi:PepSY domain-containing protein [Streptomyces qaidamensis]|uniref:PepSY domain-containing protein n=1 Tax=Streptomyces qaidamensis TaxID=1783515 RepID=UPI00131A7A08|nr:PepSY domain-containing protein [Streptomyces qaidamensis]